MLVRHANPFAKPALDLCLVRRELPGYFTCVLRHVVVYSFLLYAAAYQRLLARSTRDVAYFPG